MTPSVAIGVVRRGDHRGARLLTLVTLTVVISTTVILNTGAASAGNENHGSKDACSTHPRP